MGFFDRKHFTRAICEIHFRLFIVVVFFFIYFVFVKQNINEFRALYLSVLQRQLLLLTLVG